MNFGVNMNMVKYRSEEPYGEGYRDIIQVLYHEQYELYNNILEYI